MAVLASPDVGIRGRALLVEPTDRKRARFLIETRSLPALTRCYARSFTFYVARPARSILPFLLWLEFVLFNVVHEQVQIVRTNSILLRVFRKSRPAWRWTFS